MLGNRINKTIYVWHLILFLWIALFRTLESRASFTDWSFLTVITMGEIKFLSEHSCNFSICPCSESFFNSSDTLSNKFIGTRLFGVMGYNFDEIFNELYVLWTYQFGRLGQENQLQFAF